MQESLRDRYRGRDPNMSYSELVDKERRAKRDEYILKSGIYDSDGNINLGEMQYPEGELGDMVNNNADIYSINEMIEYEKNEHNPGGIVYIASIRKTVISAINEWQIKHLADLKKS